MNRNLIGWGLLGIAPLVGAIACSGKNLNDVGEINSGGHAGLSGSLNAAGNGEAGASDPTNQGGGAGSVSVPHGGAGGEAGAPIIELPDAGAGGEGGEGDAAFTCPTCTVVSDQQNVHGVSVSGGKVYWVDYGKTDHLGNYDNNGRLFARDLSGGAQTLIADGLTRPEELSINGDYAYLVLNRKTQSWAPDHVLRVPLAGGDPATLSTSTVNESAVRHRFSVTAGYEYWISEGGVVRVATTADAQTETVLSARGVQQITNDGTTLFFEGNGGFWSVPLAGGDPVQIYAYEDAFFEDSYYSPTAHGADLYAVRFPSLHADDKNTYLVRIPKTGGIWTRLGTLTPYVSELAIDGDRMFLAGYADNNAFNLFQGSLSTPEVQTKLLTSTSIDNSSRLRSWAVSSSGVFYGGDLGLYLTPGAP
jgi:hypothetical protein